MQKNSLKVLPIEATKKLNLDKSILYHLYVEEKKSSSEIAKIFNVSDVTIRKYLKKYNIPVRSVIESHRLAQGKFINKDTLYHLYIEEKKSTDKIAKMFNISQPSVFRYLKIYNIPTRTKVKPQLSKEILYRLYVEEEKPATEIAKILNVGKSTILRRMEEFDIKRRTISESKRGEKNPYYGKPMPEEQKKKISESHKGEKNPNYGKHLSEETKRKISEKEKGERHYNWKGGITSENIKIRNSNKMRLWRKKCLVRDNFTCKACGKKGGKLNVHHINNFSEFKELRYKPSNGITLCKECHTKFHSIYGVRNNTKGQLEEFINFVKHGVKNGKD